jgi:hypothetical protein
MFNMSASVVNAQFVVGKIPDLGLGFNSPSTRCVQACQIGLGKM